MSKRGKNENENSSRNNKKARKHQDHAAERELREDEIEEIRRLRAIKKASAIMRGEQIDITNLPRLAAQALYSHLKETGSTVPSVVAALKVCEELLNNDSNDGDLVQAEGDNDARRGGRRPSVGASKPVEFDFSSMAYQDCHRNTSQSKHLWVLNEVRDFFRDNSFWPSFIGSRVDYILEEKGALPVIVWPEQDRRILLTKKKSSKATKRSRSEVEESEAGESNSLSLSTISIYVSLLSLFL